MGNVPEESIRPVLTWALNSEHASADYLNHLHGDQLYDEADSIYNSYWKRHSIQGATCDFGGTATLERRDVLDTDDEFDDDWTDDSVTIVRGHTTFSVVSYVLIGVLVGGMIGFVVAMKTSRRFNVAVRKSFFGSMKNSQMFVGKNSFFGSENMPILDDDGEYEKINN